MQPNLKVPSDRVSDDLPAMQAIFLVLELWLGVNAVSDEIVFRDFVGVY